MILIADNAPYHHKREIGSLASLKKGNLVNLMVKHNVEYVDLPMTSTGRSELAEKEGDEDHPDVQDRGDCVQIGFVSDEQKNRASARNPRIATLEELKVAFITYLRDNKPELLACKVEKYLEGRGHKILWTPPYCPELQPIELFWAVGKNHVALQNTNHTTMKDVVKNLREGWYGNGGTFPDGHPLR